MKNILKILAGPASFAFTAFALTGTFTPAQSFAVGTAVWMALWWILRPVSIYVTAFIPILVDSFFDLIPEGHVLSQYFSEIAVLLLGSDLICQGHPGGVKQNTEKRRDLAVTPFFVPMGGMLAACPMQP